MPGAAAASYAGPGSPAWHPPRRDRGGCAIIEEWTAWCLVWERERELARGLRIKDAERSRATPREDKVTRLPRSSPPAQSAPPPEGRKAA
jgi:hypothetical protein